MKIKFEKYTGAGNDFILFDETVFIPQPEIIQRICDRHFGIGADGVILVGKSDRADFNIRYFNSDGSGDVLCLNGARCAVLYAFNHNLCEKECSFDFIEKVFHAYVVDNNNIKISLTYTPIIELNKELMVLNKKLTYHYVDFGAKHIIIFWEDFRKIPENDCGIINFEELDVRYYGRIIRNHSQFHPAGVNVNFIHITDKKEIRVRTYEKGVEGETLACGSGSVSSALVAYLKSDFKPPCKIRTTSQKEFEINFEIHNDSFTNLSIKGPAQKIFEGVIEL